jgi:NADH:ubiquinone oxidoreductase subunit C
LREHHREIRIVKLLGAENSEEVQKLLIEQYAATESASGGPPEIASARHVALARALRDEYQYCIFGFVVAAHYPAPNQEPAVTGDLIRVVYGLRSVGKGTKLASWQLCVAVGSAVPTLVHLFVGADWQEREQYDLVGVRFEGHPDLRRLMLSEDWQGHPLRKDYAIDTKVHPWR